MALNSRQSLSFRVTVKAVAVLSVVLLAIAATPARPSSAPPKERYLSPLEMALSKDGQVLYVVCEGSDELRVVNLATAAVVRSIQVGHIPRGISVSPGGDRLYVTNAWSDTVSVID